MRNKIIATLDGRSFFILLLAMVFAAAVIAAGCSGSNPAATGTASTAAGVSSAVLGTTTAAAAEQTFTTAELATYDGLNGHKAYIAVNGIVYDVTAVAQWGSKLHAGKFQAGKDYSAEIKNAPHGLEKLLAAVKIGVLKG